MDKLLEGIDHPLVNGITKVDVDENPEVSAKYGVRGLPTLIIEDEHGEVRRVQGAED
jgi:thioredoxin-like negative regulator of GroEL